MPLLKACCKHAISHSCRWCYRASCTGSKHLIWSQTASNKTTGISQLQLAIPKPSSARDLRCTHEMVVPCCNTEFRYWQCMLISSLLKVTRSPAGNLNMLARVRPVQDEAIRPQSKCCRLQVSLCMNTAMYWQKSRCPVQGCSWK